MLPISWACVYVLYWTDKENMATPAGRATRARRIRRLFAEYGADTWRSDDTHGPVVGGDNGSVKGFYDMLATLKKEIPRFQWENSSGGGLKDYGAMSAHQDPDHGHDLPRHHHAPRLLR